MAVLGVFVPAHFKTSLNRIGIHSRRKYFHIVALVLFPMSIYLDVSKSLVNMIFKTEFMKLAFALAISAMIFLECNRFNSTQIFLNYYC